jgi:hypothetical protein
LISFEGVAAIGLMLMLVQVCEIVLRDFFNTSFLWSRRWRAT